MSIIMVYDFETNGLPDFRAPSEADHQPHVVQAAANLVDTETQETISGINLIAAPDGWEIPDEVAKIHGITTEYAERVGLPEALIVHFLWCLWEQSDFRLAHNETFDARIMRIALMRFYSGESLPGEDAEPADIWKAGSALCTARMASPIMKMAATPAMIATGRKHPKTPKLTEAYEYFFGTPMPGRAHSALADVEACTAVYFAIIDHNRKGEVVDAEFEPDPNVGSADPQSKPNGGDDDVSFLGE